MALAIFVIGNIATSMTIRQWSDVTYTDISINLGLNVIGYLFGIRWITTYNFYTITIDIQITVLRRFFITIVAALRIRNAGNVL